MSRYLIPNSQIQASAPENEYLMPVVANQEEGMRGRSGQNVRRDENPFARYASVPNSADPMPKAAVGPPLPTAPRPNAVRADLLAPVEVGRRTPAAESKFDSLKK